MKINQITESRDACPVCGQTPCNCTSIKESRLSEVDPRNFDSDEDYYDAVKKQGQQQFSGDWDVWDEIASLENQIKYANSEALRYQLHKQIDQLKRDNGIEDDEDEYEKEYDADIRARKGVAEGEQDRKRNALWAQITSYERRARETKNDIKKQHLLKMADELRGKLSPTTEEKLAESLNELSALIQDSNNEHQ